MNTYIVWVEMDLAKIFKVSATEKTNQTLHRHEIKHHTSADSQNHKNCEKFFHDIAKHISDASELLLIGPGLAKDHFMTHLEHHHHQNLAKKVIGIKTMDIVSDAKILACSRDFFKQYDVLGTATSA